MNVVLPLPPSNHVRQFSFEFPGPSVAFHKCLCH